MANRLNTKAIIAMAMVFLMIAVSPHRHLYAASETKLLKISVTTPNAFTVAQRYQNKGFDVLHNSISANQFELIVNTYELEQIKSDGLHVVVLETGQPLNKIYAINTLNEGGVPTGYSDLDGVYQQMSDAASNFPNITKLVNLTQTYGTPQTVEGRDLFALKISDNVDDEENEPNVLIVSTHHAREIVVPVIALNAINELTTNYGTASNITAAVDNNEIWIAPMWNPDGYNEVIVGDNFWRKNRRVFPAGIGVDLNRNYAQGWNATCGGSTAVTSQTYRGPNPESEAETQTMIAWSQDQRFAKVIDFHSFGREVLYAYSCSSHPFETYFQNEAIALSHASGYGGDHRPAGAEGEHYQWQLAQMGSWAHLVETHTTFQPSFLQAQNEADTVWPGILHAIERPIPLTGTVTSSTTGQPVEAEIVIASINFDQGESNRSGGPFGRYHVFAPPGQYTIEFHSDLYISQTVTVELTPDNSVALDVELSPLDESDGDGIPDESDNCLVLANPEQIDIDNDGYGNVCDPDYNNDCVVNFLDYAIFAQAFLSSDPNIDANNDGIVNFIDAVILTDHFLLPPGPSAFNDLCDTSD